MRLFPSDQALIGAGLQEVLQAALSLPGGREEAARMADPHGLREWGVHAVCRFLESMRGEFRVWGLVFEMYSGDGVVVAVFELSNRRPYNPKP